MVETYFDTPEKSNDIEINKSYKFLFSNYLIMQLLESYPQIALILDSNRQIVSANKNAVKFLEETDLEKVLGKRFGEAINCIHSNEMQAGCGTSIFCTECGAAKSIKEARESLSFTTYECRITSQKNNLLNAYDLRVSTSPLYIDNYFFLIVYIEDIQSEKRKQSLERVFFHDILNTAGAIKNIVEIISEENINEDIREYVDMLKSSSAQLLNEIIFQKLIISAERNELPVNKKIISVNMILKSAYNLYSKHYLAEDKEFSVEYLKNDIEIETDKTIVIRSIGNLIKNALEATKKSNKVKLFAEIKNEWIYFNIWNEGVIPQDVQLQIFQRSFSTKSKEGRGIGTYSVKLFIENFLNGKVFFNSNEKEQTCFTIALLRNEIA